MTALVVFESMFGDNQRVAEAIAAGLAPGLAAEVVEVGVAPAAVPTGVTLLVAGGPNHGFGMSRPSTRRDAAKQAAGALVSAGIGLREWLDALPPAEHGVAAVAWDTQVSRPRILRLIDRSARGIEKRLRKRGFRIAAPAEHFYVTGATGPLVDGEEERARRWGEQLAVMMTGARGAGG